MNPGPHPGFKRHFKNRWQPPFDKTNINSSQWKMDWSGGRRVPLNPEPKQGQSVWKIYPTIHRQVQNLHGGPGRHLKWKRKNLFINRKQYLENSCQKKRKKRNKMSSNGETPQGPRGFPSAWKFRTSLRCCREKILGKKNKTT